MTDKTRQITAAARSFTPRATSKLLLAGLLGLAAATPAFGAILDCDENDVYFRFYDKNGAPLYTGSAYVHIDEYDSTQDPCDDIETDTDKGSDDNQIRLRWEVDRRKDDDTGDWFLDNIENDNGTVPPVLGLGLGDDQDEYSYLPEELNLAIQFDIKDINLRDGRTMQIRNLVTAQGSDTNSARTYLSVGKAVGETIYSAFHLEIVGTMRSLVEVARTATDLSFRNNWYVSQSNEQNDKVYMIHYRGGPGLVVCGEASDGSLIPVVITEGSDVFKFDCYVLGVGGGTPPAYFSSKKIGGGLSFDPNLGIIRLLPNSEWIQSPRLGPLYTVAISDTILWVYCDEQGDWLYVDRDIPGAYYSLLTEAWYIFNRDTLTFDMVLPEDIQ